jgi:hypothetical protein
LKFVVNSTLNSRQQTERFSATNNRNAGMFDFAILPRN